MASWILARILEVVQVFKGTNSTTLTEKHIPKVDLRGKWIIISGGNNGIGFEAAKTFASWGANLVLACRGEVPSWEQHPEAVVEEFKGLAEAEGYSESVIEWWEVDMADLDSVEAFCRRWMKGGDRVLDILCNNAGVGTHSKKRMTKDGFQLLHQVNLLSHVLLTLRLLPSLARSTAPRIVCTTSSAHHVGRLELDGDRFNSGPDMRGNDYANNKLYFQMWVAEMQTRLLAHVEYRHVTINGVNPGYVASGIWNDTGNHVAARVMKFMARIFAITPQQGSLAIVHAATSEVLGPDRGGRYFNRIWDAPPKSCCNDPVSRGKLWIKLDEELHLEEKGLLTVLGL